MSRDPEQDSKSEEHSDDSKCAPETEPRRVDGELPAPGDPASPPAPAVSPSALATAPNLPPATPHASTPTTAAPAAGQELPIAQANEIQPVPETSQRRPDGFRDWVIERLQLLYSIPQKLEDMIAENEKRQAEAQEELFELVRKRRTLVDKREPVAEVIGPYLRKLENVAPLIGISLEDIRRAVWSGGPQVVAGDTQAWKVVETSATESGQAESEPASTNAVNLNTEDTPAAPTANEQKAAIQAAPTPAESTSAKPCELPPPEEPPLNPQEKFGIEAARYNEELRRIARAAQGKRKFDEQDARDQFSDLSFWKALDNSRISETSRKEMFLDTQQSFGTRTGRFKIIGELMGVADTTAYDYYKAWRRAQRQHE